MAEMAYSTEYYACVDVMYHIFIYSNSYDILSNLTNRLRIYSPRICNNINVAKSINKFVNTMEAKYNLETINLLNLGEESFAQIKDAYTRTPEDVKHNVLINMLYSDSRWIPIERPDMCKELMYFVSKLMKDKVGYELIEITVKFFNLKPVGTIIQKKKVKI